MPYRPPNPLPLKIRRARVAELRVMGYLTAREIVKQLTKEDIINPNTGEAWTTETIYNDIRQIEAEADASISSNAEVHRRRQLEEIALLKRKGHESGDHRLVLKAIELEMKLLGTQAPLKIEFSLVMNLIKQLEIVGVEPQQFFTRALERLESGTNNG